MTTAQQDREFIEDLIPSALLEEAIEWIGSNLNPADVFETKDLEEWAENNGYVEE